MFPSLETILHTSPSKSFNIAVCEPLDPSRRTVGINVIDGLSASVASPCFFNNSDPFFDMEHSRIGSGSNSNDLAH